MSSSFTTSGTFTIAGARHVTAKVKADLKLMQRAYGQPSDGAIDEYGEEAAQLLVKGYLGVVTYGFKRGSDWVVALRYTANNDGTLTSDDRAGQIPRGVAVAGLPFYSFLTYSAKWHNLTQSQREAFERTLPIQRGTAPEPGTAGGSWTGGSNYSSNGSGVSRATLRPL